MFWTLDAMMKIQLITENNEKYGRIRRKSGRRMTSWLQNIQNWTETPATIDLFSSTQDKNLNNCVSCVQ